MIETFLFVRLGEGECRSIHLAWSFRRHGS